MTGEKGETSRRSKRQGGEGREDLHTSREVWDKGGVVRQSPPLCSNDRLGTSQASGAAFDDNVVGKCFRGAAVPGELLQGLRKRAYSVGRRHAHPSVGQHQLREGECLFAFLGAPSKECSSVCV